MENIYSIKAFSLNKEKKQKFCEGDYRQATPKESYFDNRKSWCTTFD